MLMDRRVALDYGLRLGECGASAAACGLWLAPTHPGWPVAAALLVMRPAPDMQRLRSVGRVLAVLGGGGAALLLLGAHPPGWGYALICLGVLALAAATQGSRWYVTPAYTSLLVLLLMLHADPAQAHGRFNERVTATLAGVALAYLFGLLLPGWASAAGPGGLRLLPGRCAARTVTPSGSVWGRPEPGEFEQRHDHAHRGPVPVRATRPLRRRLRGPGAAQRPAAAGARGLGPGPGHRDRRPLGAAGGRRHAGLCEAGPADRSGTAAGKPALHREPLPDPHLLPVRHRPGRHRQPRLRCLA
ncbi:hypothetical protein GXW82_30705 [Streptacidiphilus sp. 4-A2]|nr:hypothetical protein [Streptacidiphilus sp. 4-A2]